MIAGLILAAGESSRMGRDKALLPYRGKTFLKTIIHTLRTSGIERIVVVLGHHADEIQKAANLEGVEVVINPDHRLGQTSSLQAGLGAVAAVSPPPPAGKESGGEDIAVAGEDCSGELCSPVRDGDRRSPLQSDGKDNAATSDELEAVVLCLVDHPEVSAATVRALVDSFKHYPAPVVIPTYQNRRGHPVIIARALFWELLALGPSEGANTLIRKYRDQTRFVEVDDPGVLLDVDSPEVYSQLNAAPEN